jgi:hypothetical protein
MHEPLQIDEPSGGGDVGSTVAMMSPIDDPSPPPHASAPHASAAQLPVRREALPIQQAPLDLAPPHSIPRPPTGVAAPSMLPWRLGAALGGLLLGALLGVAVLALADRLGVAHADTASPSRMLAEVAPCPSDAALSDAALSDAALSDAVGDAKTSEVEP